MDVRSAVASPRFSFTASTGNTGWWSLVSRTSTLIDATSPTIGDIPSSRPEHWPQHKPRPSVYSARSSRSKTPHVFSKTWPRLWWEKTRKFSLPSPMSRNCAVAVSESPISQSVCEFNRFIGTLRPLTREPGDEFSNTCPWKNGTCSTVLFPRAHGARRVKNVSQIMFGCFPNSGTLKCSGDSGIRGATHSLPEPPLLSLKSKSSIQLAPRSASRVWTFGCASPPLLSSLCSNGAVSLCASRKMFPTARVRAPSPFSLSFACCVSDRSHITFNPSCVWAAANCAHPHITSRRICALFLADQKSVSILRMKLTETWFVAETSQTQQIYARPPVTECCDRKKSTSQQWSRESTRVPGPVQTPPQS